MNLLLRNRYKCCGEHLGQSKCGIDAPGSILHAMDVEIKPIARFEGVKSGIWCVRVVRPEAKQLESAQIHRETLAVQWIFTF